MQRLMLKSKIHGATITDKQLHYKGSITLDRLLLNASDILPGEQVHVLNLNTGARFITYAILARAGSGAVVLNGPAARLGEIGDKVIILTYCQCDDNEAGKIKPRIVHVDDKNRRRSDAAGAKHIDRQEI
ncbi:MAG: aspartate 1-decarboxylase [Kiritimatiellia bacterium]